MTIADINEQPRGFAPGKNLPPLNDHAFMRILREQVTTTRKPMTRIALELGVDVDDLCDWIMAYREPKPRKAVDNSKYGPPIAAAGVPIRSQKSLARQFATWRRGKDGAAATRRMLEEQGR